MNRNLFHRWGRGALALLLVLLSLSMAAPCARAQEFLDPADAFKMSAQMIDGQTVAVTYEIADGYYMYRERFKFVAAGAKLGVPQFPAGTVHFDENFGKNVETYKRSVTIRMPVQAQGMFTLTVTGQGCADAGLCYPPQDATVRLVAASPAAAAGDGGGGADGGADK
ncbi:protein-disulfide reductase DsbD, partial [Massilia arenosa]